MKNSIVNVLHNKTVFVSWRVIYLSHSMTNLVFSFYAQPVYFYTLVRLWKSNPTESSYNVPTKGGSSFRSHSPFLDTRKRTKAHLSTCKQHVCRSNMCIMCVCRTLVCKIIVKINTTRRQFGMVVNYNGRRARVPESRITAATV